MADRTEFHNLLNTSQFSTLFILLEQTEFEQFRNLIVEGEIFFRIEQKILDDRKKKTKLFVKDKIKKEFLKLFWSEYIPSSRHLNRLLIDENVVFLKQYFSEVTEPNHKLLLYAADKYPNQLIKAIRITQAFLTDSHFESFSFFKTSDFQLHRHYAAFKALREKENELFTRATSHLFIDELNPVQWLYVIFIHYELRKRAARENKEQIFDHAVNHFKLIQTYNVFLSYVIKNNTNDFGSKFQPADILRECRLLMEKGEFEYEVWKYIEVLKDWRLWYEFVHDRLETYCYDLNYDIEIKADIVHFSPIDPTEKCQRLASSIATSIFFSKWDKNAADLAPDLFYQLIRKYPDKFLDPIKDINNFVSAGLFSLNFSKTFLLSFFYGFDAIDNQKITVLLFLLSASKTSASNTYGQSIEKIRANDNLDWLMKLLTTTFDFNPDHVPLKTFKISNWDKHCRELLGLDFYEEGIHMTTVFDVNNVTDKFNRFNPFINLWQKPHLKFGDTICFLTTILADMDPAIVALESYLNRPGKSSESQNEVKEQEKRFANIFREYGFEKVYGQFEIKEESQNKTVGEVDILLYEGNELLIIEMKRSRLPLTPAEQRCEQYEVVDYATGQLQKLIKYIQANPGCLLKKCGITENQVKSAHISGCVLNMYHHMDGTLLAENICKTSFVSLFHNLKLCKAQTENKVSTFIRNASAPFINPKHMKITPGQYDFVI